jgi:hypothetical protein
MCRGQKSYLLALLAYAYNSSTLKARQEDQEFIQYEPGLHSNMYSPKKKSFKICYTHSNDYYNKKTDKNQQQKKHIEQSARKNRYKFQVAFSSVVMVAPLISPICYV